MPADERGESGERPELITLGQASGEDGGVRVTFYGLPFLIRRGSGSRRYAYPDFGADLRHSLLDEGRIPMAVCRGVIRKRYHCCLCGAEFAAGDEARCRFDLPLTLRDLPPFRVVVEMSCAECRECGAGQVRPDRAVLSSITEAVIRAFETTGIQP